MRVTPIIALVALATGCMHPPYIVPVAGSDTNPAHPNEAKVTTAGVHLRIDTRAWKGTPDDLAWVITPVEVSLQNDSDRPLRIALKDFGLRNSTGFQASAVPPYRIHMPGVPTTVAPGYAGTDFFVAQPFMGVYPGYPQWTGPFDVNQDWYSNYAYWAPPLPSTDMLSYALPEGVLNRGGRVRGFIYFQRVPNHPEPLTFVAKLVDAGSGKAFGTATIPLFVNPPKPQ